jgi:transposase
MEYYAGIDVSLESASLCVVNATGRIVREAKVATEPEILIGWSRDLGLAVTRSVLEAGPLSQWLYAGMRDAGLAVELLETRHVRDPFKTMPVQTDRKDARGIAQLMRLGWFRPVHCKSLPAQEVRALLTARKLLQTKILSQELKCRKGRTRKSPEALLLSCGTEAEEAGEAAVAAGTAVDAMPRGDWADGRPRSRRR